MTVAAMRLLPGFLKSRPCFAPRTLMALCGLLLSAQASAYDGAHLHDDSDGRDWPAFGRTYGEQHFSPLAEINENTVGQLKLAWSYDLPQGNSVSAPVAVDGVIYTATGYSVVRALDGATGKLLWTYDPQAAKVAGRKLRAGWGIRGLAYWNNKIYVGTQDGRLLALDAKTGRPLWSVLTVDKNDVRFISGPPRVFNGNVIIGHGGADVGSIRGYVTTYDAETGRQLWRFWTVPGNPSDGFENPAMEMAAKTWAGEWWKHGGGGTVWNAITYDAEFDTIYIGVGNGAPWNHKIRSAGKGDNLFLTSVVALDAKTGTYKWHYQTTPGEAWDYNASMDMQLATLMIGGERRKVLMQAPKNGFFYVIDRTTGKLISAEPYAKVTWASHIDLESGRPVEMPGIRYEDAPATLWPGPNGAHSWMPMSFDPRRNLVFIPKFEMPGTYDQTGIDPAKWRRPGGSATDVGANIGLDSSLPEAGTSALVARDVTTQKVVWQVDTPGFWNGGTMATAGNLVFQGQADGLFNAYASATGKRLWSFDAGVGVLAPPITYQVKGRQQVTVLSGFGSSGALFGEKVARFGWEARSQARRILTFTLDGTATLPPSPPPYVAKAAHDPAFVEDAAQQQRGLMVYAKRCLVCHGVDVAAAGLAPDLRASTIPADAATFDKVVRKGALVTRGMPRFEELPRGEIAAVRQYIRSVAHRLAVEGAAR
ncbi:MAG: PQQ-dependent dehydrogenase, methanol/ethanol family [Zoogloea oleivorans]|nr:PQQ-dependent dehydrogenase, methanol/ethanol family [Zoogloea oleivorans]